ncbi:outer membrane lipoprotein carrier protein LolA [Achromobacter xylosoxidans]|uniref:outer membrane lipoprotein carrier protein LolA n=1 Tax=Alcaligenes xylosoxydans xylosoxydans TaxID=85698 RepID=UPI00064D9E26|nr:outer membrane lipoprotein carrier protein LolA [Achromobacter xylosoxidans]KMJ88848.1 membrane protein [Achromobacter xylosoxidans]MBK1979299.1 outer membrane lipoprotein carrier protein LolA [Achromobacter xylosoxidans]MEC6413391.1 outer membrane lipoprotein carrier protein LolA [Achromobacter xylosoxidans]QKI72453.1 outer membrane lipoprotein carrier protein LolA [Achromobacter xylosoxidans]
MKRLLICLALAILPWSAQAFDLDDLQQQLRATPIVRGHFVQQKFLRSLPQPLTSRGDFTLAAGRGLLWLLRSPIVQDLRISANGIARRGPDGAWQALPQQTGAGRENRLFLSVLAGDTNGLRENFDLSLSGGPDAWQLTLLPRSVLLRQIFENIQINGGRLVHRIELREVQGDRSVLQMTDAAAAEALTPEEQRAFAD